MRWLCRVRGWLGAGESLEDDPVTTLASVYLQEAVLREARFVFFGTPPGASSGDLAGSDGVLRVWLQSAGGALREVRPGLPAHLLVRVMQVLMDRPPAPEGWGVEVRLSERGSFVVELTPTEERCVGPGGG